MAVARTLEGAQDTLFAIGIGNRSPADLCTNVTRHILEAMPRLGVQRFIWCGGASSFVEDDRITFGAKFVRFIAKSFFGPMHSDKEHQLALLNKNKHVH